MGRADDLARHSVRPLLPGPEEALREEVLRLGAELAGMPALARHAAVEALAIRGLAAGEARLLAGEGKRLGVGVVASRRGDRAVVMGSLVAVADLPMRLRAAGGDAGHSLGLAIADCLAAKGMRPWGFRAGPHRLASGRRTLVMGIVNATPDSFSGDGLGDDVDAAVARGLAMAAAGADILDVGGESTRPNSRPVDVEEELRRVVPVVERLAAATPVPVSVDTRKAAVAERAIAAGAVIVNDVWGLRRDPRMAEVCAAADVGVVLMHNQRGTEYVDLMEDVAATLRESVAVAERAGIDSERLCVDPGIGFAKTPAQNLEVLRRLAELRGLGRPIMVGPSRKSTVGMLLAGAGGDPAPSQERIEGSLALCALAVQAGADLVRVHDVVETVRAMRVADAVVRGTPAGLRSAPPPGPTG